MEFLPKPRAKYNFLSVSTCPAARLEFRQVIFSLEKDKKNVSPTGARSEAPGRSAELGDFFRKLQPEMRRPKPSPDAIAAAMEAAQRLAAEADAEAASDDAAEDLVSESDFVVCSVCGYRNRHGNKFCAMCGVAVVGPQAPERETLPGH
jgi:rubrerythrin